MGYTPVVFGKPLAKFARGKSAQVVAKKEDEVALFAKSAEE
jgi:hypothetical protein